MKKTSSYRIAFMALLAGLLASASARAQAGTSTTMVATDGSSRVVSTAALANGPAVSGTTLRLNQPPSPESTASYYDSSHKDLRQSLAWMQETNAVAPTYWNMYTEAQIRLHMQDYTGASTTAEQAYQLALKHMPVSQEYVMLSAAVAAKAHELSKR